MQEELDKQKQDAYAAYVKEITPVHNPVSQMARAFLTGGAICTAGQFMINTAVGAGQDLQTACSWCSLILIFCSVLLTGLGLYSKLAKWGGAGALVPITGFANGISAAAIEYRAEGRVFGIGSKIFVIAGPVILYGIVSSFVLGLMEWLMKVL